MLLPVALLLLLFGGPAAACTCMIVTKGASADGNAIVTYAADSHTLVCLCLIVSPCLLRFGWWWITIERG